MRAHGMPHYIRHKIRKGFAALSIPAEHATDEIGSLLYVIHCAHFDGPKFGAVVGSGSIEVNGRRYDPARIRRRGERVTFLLRDYPSICRGACPSP